MAERTKRITVIFYRTDSGNEPVRDWLKGLDAADRKIIGDDLQTLEYGWPVGMPLCRSITGYRGLWELRSTLTQRRISRVLFCIAYQRLVALHGFIKKTRKTPERDLKLAAQRMKGETEDG